MALYVDLLVNHKLIHKIVARNLQISEGNKVLYVVKRYKIFGDNNWRLAETLGYVWHNPDDGAIILSQKMLELYYKSLKE